MCGPPTPHRPGRRPQRDPTCAKARRRGRHCGPVLDDRLSISRTGARIPTPGIRQMPFNCVRSCVRLASRGHRRRAPWARKRDRPPVVLRPLAWWRRTHLIRLRGILCELPVAQSRMTQESWSTSPKPSSTGARHRMRFTLGLASPRSAGYGPPNREGPVWGDCVEKLENRVWPRNSPN